MMKKSIIKIFGKKLKNIDTDEISKIKIDLRELTVANIKYILQKSLKERTSEEIACLKNFVLLKTKFSACILALLFAHSGLYGCFSFKGTFPVILQYFTPIFLLTPSECKYGLI